MALLREVFDWGNPGRLAHKAIFRLCARNTAPSCQVHRLWAAHCEPSLQCPGNPAFPAPCPNFTFRKAAVTLLRFITQRAAVCLPFYRVLRPGQPAHLSSRQAQGEARALIQQCSCRECLLFFVLNGAVCLVCRLTDWRVIWIHPWVHSAHMDGLRVSCLRKPTVFNQVAIAHA